MTRDFWKDGFTVEDLIGHVPEMVRYPVIHVQDAVDRANAILKAELKKIKWHEPNEGPITVEGMMVLRDEDDGHHD